MQVCTSLQTDNHASTPPLSFLQAGCPSCRPASSVKALKAEYCTCVLVCTGGWTGRCVCVLVYRRIADNQLSCDCRLTWLSKWLRLHPTLGLFTRCASPTSLRGRQLTELQQSSFVCNDGSSRDYSCVFIVTFLYLRAVVRAKTVSLSVRHIAYFTVHFCILCK